ncbi:nectin-4-like isoform X1 [Myxocyprinus asiaticus]|uniref:nectin-4-like isoform X1 n=1 Tax=Myxocyprinus asiaticus TaxID=70543 RepID=UPI0022223C78|nr:nectin-4-like isoform X1 [Myxocyprinus asiaticus]
MAEATYKLLILLCITRGTYCLVVHHNESVTAVEGQNISLPCIVGEEHDVNINQLEWIKKQKESDQKIVVFNPQFSIYYFLQNFHLQLMNSSKTGKFQGSILNLHKVKVNDSGNYICEITSFPNGSFRRTTQLQVTELPVSVKLSYPYGFIKEGDEVKITCSASHSPLRYKLQRSKEKVFLLESSNGEFILQNVTRSNSDLYVCFPEWDSLAHNQQGFNTTMELTVNFLDSIECNTSSPLQVSAGEDVVISCKANTSQSLQYIWMKGDTVVSSSDTLSLSSVTSDHSGIYQLTAAFLNNQLQADIDLSIQVLTKTSEGITMQTTHSVVRSFSTAYPFLSQTTKHLSNFISVETSSWNRDTAVTTTESGHLQTSTATSHATMSTLELSTRHKSPFIGNSSPPPVGIASTLHATTVNSTRTSYEVNLSTAPDPTTRSKVFTSAVLEKNITANSTMIGPSVTTPKASKSSAYIAVPIVLLLLVLIMLLYRRHLNQKRMDMPPPFKPPPPPVKYTSVRNQDVPMTDFHAL